jgi:Na+/alanine symporter
MSRALAISRPRGDTRLARLRRGAHWAMARAAFAAETIAIALGFFELLTLAMLQGDRLLAAHEWGLFLTHYAAAAAPARTPVDLALLAIVLVLSAFVAVCRWPAARLAWRTAKPSGARIRGR